MLELAVYENAVIVPRRTKRDKAVGLFAEGHFVPWSNADIVVVPSPAVDCAPPDVPVCERADEVIFIGTLWCMWGHLITDFARHLWPLLRQDRSLKVAYAVGGPKQRLPVNFLQLLVALGVERGRLIEVREPMRFRKVYFGAPSFWHEQGICRWTEEYAEMIETIRANLLEPLPRVVPTRRVYLTRTLFAQNRKDFGEALVESAYRDAGFEIVAPEKLTFAEMVRLFAETAVLAATEGSVSHNALFLPKGARLEVLRKCDWVNVYQMAINEIRELDVSVYPVSVGNLLAVSAEPWRGPFLMGVTPELAAHLGCVPRRSRLEEWRCRWCRFKMWLKAHRI